MHTQRTKAGAVVVAAAATLGWLGYTAFTLGSRPERTAPRRVLRDDGPPPAEAHARRPGPTTPAVAREWVPSASPAMMETSLTALSNRIALAGTTPAGSGVLAQRLGENIKTILTPLLGGQGDQFRATLATLGAAPPREPKPETAPGGGGGNPLFKALVGAQLDLANAKVRHLSAEEAKQGPMGGRRRGGPSAGGGGGGEDDFGAVVAAGFRGAFPASEKSVEAGSARVVEVTVPLLIDGATDPDPNARVTFRMAYDPAADAWQPMLLALALQDPAILQKFAPQGD